ncbi:hypothetical protein D9M68_658090 [compost metagenome]
MSLWRQTPNLDQLNATSKNTIGEQFDIHLSGEDGKISCISRLTMAIVALGENGPVRC